jgi:hypothetical protein
VAGGFNAQPSASTLDGVSQSRRLALVLGLNLALVAALVIVGVVAHPLGVLAAGVDYLADAAAIGVSLMAIRLAQRHCYVVRGLRGTSTATSWMSSYSHGETPKQPGGSCVNCSRAYAMCRACW